MKAETLTLAKEIGIIIEEKHGRDIVIIDISNQSSFADFFVNATAGNVRILATLQDEIEKRMAPAGLLARGVEGRPDSGWVLLDFGDIIVNLFSEEQRNNYQIEKIWSDGAFITG